MPEMRKPGNGSKPTSTRGGSPNGVRRKPQDRRIVQRQGPVPRWMYIVLIVVPTVLIGVLLGLKAMKNRPAPKVEVVQPGDRIKELEMEVPKIEKAYYEVQKLLRSQDPADNKKGNAKAEELRKRMEDWLGEFDGFLDSKRDADDKLPPELQGYMVIRRPVSQFLSDLNKTTGF